jgi:hypothetical protein
LEKIPAKRQTLTEASAHSNCAGARHNFPRLQLCYSSIYPGPRSSIRQMLEERQENAQQKNQECNYFIAFGGIGNVSHRHKNLGRRVVPLFMEKYSVKYSC